MNHEEAMASHMCAVDAPTPREAYHWASGQMDNAADALAAKEAQSLADYKTFLLSKNHSARPCGFEVDRSAIHPLLGDWRTDICRWGIKRGRAAFFEACGLGKTFQQLEWARIIAQRVNRPILLMCPLAVAEQTLEESLLWTGQLKRKNKASMSYPIWVVRDQSQIGDGINIANYDILEHFDPRFEWGGMVLDESSILKAMDGATRDALIAFAKDIPYRLCCSATPSPNDHMELGNQAEFLGIMTYTEMLAVFFTHDGGDTSKWRLKGHAQTKFWEWLATWCIAIRKPSDIGYSDEGFDLPELVYHHHIVESPVPAGMLFAPTAGDIQERRQARRDSLALRVAKAKELVDAESKEQWLMWCNLNDESEALKVATGGCEVKGSDTPAYKATSLLAFAHGKVKDLISKVTIAGFGMNFQSCAREIIFPTDSWEQFHQGIRRCWRFGQKRTVHAHLIYSESEKAVIENLQRKETQYNEMMESMVEHMKNAMVKEIQGATTEVAEYGKDQRKGDNWTADLGDSCEVLATIDSDSIDYSIFSPPFASLYTYSNSERDMGNCKDFSEFAKHFAFLAPQLFRVIKPGRLLSFHCMQLPKSITRDGVIGLMDFRGLMIKMFEDAGFVFHSEVCIWKDPVTAMQRTKALGLLHKQVKKDSCMSRQGIPDYLVTMRKPGVNASPVSGMFDEYVGAEGTGPNPAIDPTRFSIEVWQRYASPVWMDINQSRTLNRKDARDEQDERHVCPLQLQVIERALDLWTNEGDLVLSPFAGIGSEGYCAVKMGRQFRGVELKRSYWKLMCKYLGYAERERLTGDAPLFAEVAIADDESEDALSPTVEESEYVKIARSAHRPDQVVE